MDTTKTQYTNELNIVVSYIVHEVFIELFELGVTSCYLQVGNLYLSVTKSHRQVSNSCMLVSNLKRRVTK